MFVATVFGFVSWATFPEHDPFSIDSNPQFRESARYTVIALGAFLCGAGLLIYGIDQRRHQQKK